MTNNSTSSTDTKWTGMVPVDDTALAVTDTGGPGLPVIYLNGQFATQGYWRRTIAELGGDEQEQIRASLDEVTARNPNLKVSAKVASNHGAILRKDFRAIAEAVREVAPLDQGRS
jgi:hypothetical protein